jgi:putative restriction endonuclease
MAHLSILAAEFGEDIPYVGGLHRGFPFRGRRIPFLNRQKGIYRSAAQTGPAALSIQTSAKSPYDDEIAEDGFIYAYRSGDINQSDNRALRAAYELQVPIIYFIGTRPGWYKPVFPCYVRSDDPVTRSVVVTPGAFVGPVDEPEPTVRNGLSLCSIHHRAFDQSLVGVSPDYIVQVSRRLLEDEDGPMLDLLKGFHNIPLHLPERERDRPDRERLELRYERFLELAA